MTNKILLVTIGSVLLIILVGCLIFFYISVIHPGKSNYDVWSMPQMKVNFEKYINSDEYDHPIGVPILYINMDRSKKRREFMEQQLSLLSSDYERTPGVDGKKLLSITHGKANNISFQNNYELTFSELGCTLSHVMAAKRVLERDLEVALIMEDDCIGYLLPYWKTTISQIMQKAPDDWEIIQLFGGNCMFNTTTELFFSNHSCWSTVAYLLRKSGAISILKTCGIDSRQLVNNQTIKLGPKKTGRKIPRRGLADTFIYEAAKTYVYSKPLFFCGDEFLESTIHRSHENGHIAEVKRLISLYKNKKI